MANPIEHVVIIVKENHAFDNYDIPAHWAFAQH